MQNTNAAVQLRWLISMLLTTDTVLESQYSIEITGH